MILNLKTGSNTFLNLHPHLENEAWDEHVAIDDTFIENEDLDKPITETEVYMPYKILKPENHLE